MKSEEIHALRLAVELCHKSYFEQLHPVWALDVLEVTKGTDDAYFFEGNNRSHLTVRGTELTWKEWFKNAQFLRKIYVEGLGWVHRGMYANVEAIWAELIKHPAFPDPNINIEGHSLGAAICIMLAKKHKDKYNSNPKVITFGGAKFTDKRSAALYDSLDITQVVHTLDPVPYLLVFLYKHVGKRMRLWGGGRKHGIDGYFKTIFRLQ